MVHQKAPSGGLHTSLSLNFKTCGFVYWGGSHVAVGIFNCICAFILCHCRSFNPSLCHLSSFLLPYVVVSRPFCSLELTLTGPHQRNRQIHSGKVFIGSFDLHDLSDLRSLILIPMECTHCGRNNTSWRKLYTPLNHMHEEGSDLSGMHIPTSRERPTLRTLLVVYSSYYAYNYNSKTYSIT